METNPYQSPDVAETTLNVDSADPVVIRRAHLNYETLFKFLGWYWVLFSLLRIHIYSRFEWAFIPLMILQGICGIGLCKLKSWARIPATILLLISLWPFSSTAILKLLVLAVIWTPKGRRIFANDYRSIIAATPQLKCWKSQMALLILAALILLFVIPGFIHYIPVVW